MALLGLFLPPTLFVVLADDTEVNSPATSGESKLSYTVGEKYTVVIPTTISLTDQAGTDGKWGTGTANVTLKASDNALKIPSAYTLAVALSTGQELYLTTDGDDAPGLAYAVKKDDGTPVSANAVSFVSAPARTTTDVTQSLYIESGAPKLAGNYTGTLNFTVNVVPQDITIAGELWRILSMDIDPNTAGNQALVIRKNALTEKEMGLGASETSRPSINFLSETATGDLGAGYSEGQRGYYYFDNDGSNGYEDSGLAAGYGLKAAIDNYYNNYIKDTEADSRVNKVLLNNPTLAEWNTAHNLSWTYNSGSYDSDEFGHYYNDTNFKTSVDNTSGTKQAFALSYGDLNSIGMDVKADVFNFLFPFSFWTRSVGADFQRAGRVNGNSVNGSVYNHSSLVGELVGEGSQKRLVRPALVYTIDGDNTITPLSPIAPYPPPLPS
ncbi:MAG: hypothetical protein LBS41_03920 [Streptococcaceae bacterium]|nr:hypothetical protein [Streptococcaceae bacterium]